MEDFRVEYDSLVHFQQRLKSAGPVMKERLKAANKSVAQLVVDKAQGKASMEDRQAAKAAASLRASNTVGSAQVKGGSARLPFFYGAEFGAKQYAQFKTWRGNQGANAFEGGAGYFLYPTIREHQSEILNKFRESVTDALVPAWRD